MKICYVTTNICAMNGLARVTIAKANALAAIDGNQVAIIVRYHNEVALRPLDKRVKLVHLKLFYPEDRHTLYGGNNHLVPFREMKQRLHDYAYRLLTVMQKLQPDVVISTGTDEVAIVGNMDMPWRPVRIREFHLASDWRLQYRLWGEMLKRMAAYFVNRRDYRRSLRQYDRLVVLTDSDRHNFWHDDPRVVTIPNMLTLDAVPKPSALNQKVVVAAGRICWQKHFELLARAWALVVKRHPDWQLRLYGDGSRKDENRLRRQIAKSGVADSFRLMGRTRNMIRALGEASIFALSSRYEGFGLVITEAMACGVPVVSTDCPYGPSDIITQGKDGYLVAMDDAGALADRICSLIENDALRHSMGRAAIATADKYKTDVVARQWMRLFADLINAK